jgi:hypothetical protein
MPTAFACPSCQTRFARKPTDRQCPACGFHLRAASPPPGASQPLIYWRVVGVALGTCALFIITTMFALKAWGEAKRSALSSPVKNDEKNAVPEFVEPQVEAPVLEPADTPPLAPMEQPAPKKERSQDVAVAPAAPVSESATAPANYPETKMDVATPSQTKNSTSPQAQFAFKRLDNRCEEDLRKELVEVPIFEKNQIPQATRRLLAAAPRDKAHSSETKPDFAGLPMRMGVHCQSGKEPAENLQVLSTKLHAVLTAAIVPNANDPRPNVEVLRKSLLEDSGSGKPGWLQPEAIPALVQILMAENKPVRLLLVELLARIPSREAGVALAQRAVFDLSSDVREAAIRALKDRPREQFRDTLLEGFRFPWAAANEHAAEALAALDAKETASALVKLLDQPAPTAPTPIGSDRKLHVREMVRINHLSSCTFCHPRSLVATDLVRGQVPDPNQRVSPGAYQTERPLSFVRADITYLRQDFSVIQPVANPGPWPAFQRFDYVIRTRPATLDEEIFERPDNPAANRQRQAILFALRELTGTDAGSTVKSWRRKLAEVAKPEPSGFN